MVRTRLLPDWRTLHLGQVKQGQVNMYISKNRCKQQSDLYITANAPVVMYWCKSLGCCKQDIQKKHTNTSHTVLTDTTRMTTSHTQKHTQRNTHAWSTQHTCMNPGNKVKVITLPLSRLPASCPAVLYFLCPVHTHTLHTLTALFDWSYLSPLPSLSN